MQATDQHNDAARAPLSDPSGAGVDRRWIALALLTFIYTLNYVDRQIVIILQEPIKADFKLNDWEVGLLTGGAFGILYTLAGIPIANWLDRGVNRIKVVSVMVAVWSLLTAVCGLTRTFPQFMIARMGVGLAESGYSPASHALLSDFYTPRERPRAVGIFALGVPIGMTLGMAAGGIIAEQVGWRMALFFAGIPGILVAIVLPLLVKEPPRGGTDVQSTAEESLSFTAAMRLLFSRPSFVHTVVGSCFIAFIQSGILGWLPSMFIRSHGMSLAQAGLIIGLLSGLGGIAGTYAGGWQASHMAKKGLHRMLLIPILGFLLALPFFFGAFLATDLTLALFLLPIPTFLAMFWSAPSIAMVQTLSPPAARARASAIYIVAANLIGSSMGPVAAGAMSDMFAAAAGNDAAIGLRNSLLVMSSLLILPALQWTFAVRAIRREQAAT